MKNFFRASGLVSLFLAGWTIVLAQTGSKTPIRNGVLQTNMDYAGFKGVNSAAPTAPGDLATKAYVDANGGGGGGGGGGGLISITGDDGTATGLSLTITGNTNPLTDPVFTLGGNLSISHGGTGASTANAARTNLGLGNVNDTSDLGKPISTATQAALDLKVSSADVTSALAAFVGSANLTTLGTITTGTWHADPIGAAYLPSLNGLSAPNGDVSLGSQKATNMANPVASTDGANKQYVDSVAAGGVPHPAVATSSTGNLTLLGEQTIDGVLTSTSRILVKDQSSATANGIYVTAAGAWSRATDADSGPELAGSVFVTGGTAGAGRTWAVTTPQPIVVGTDNVAYTQIAAAVAYTANGGITLTSNNFALSSMAANSVKGNNTGSPAAAADLNMTQLKTMESLNNVENTALSTWAGSGNITALGTIATGTVPLARVSGINTVGGNLLTSLAPTANTTWIKINTNGTLTQRTNGELLGDIGGESALTFNAPFIRTGNILTMAVASSTQAGALSLTDWSTFNNKVGTGRKITTTAPLTGGGDFGADRNFGINVATAIQDGYLTKENFISFNAKTPPDSIVTFNNNGTTGSPATWTTGATAAREIGAITLADKFAVLPPASAYAPGKRIVYTDGQTGGAFGRWFRRNGTDLLNGASGDFRAFIGGSLGPFGSKSVEFEDIDGTQWQVVTTASTLFHVEDAANPAKFVQISAALQTAGVPGTITAGIGDTMTVAPGSASDPSQGVIGVDPLTGALLYGTLGLPSTSGHAPGETLQVQSDLTAGFSAAAGGSSSFQTLDGSVEPIVWNCVAGKTQQNAYVLLTSSNGGLHSIVVNGLNSGYSLHLIVKQDSGGGRTITALPANSGMEAAGAGVPTLTGTANSVDELFADYSGIPGVEMLWTIRTNFTKTILAACGTLGAQGATGTGGNIGQNAASRTAIAASFLATTTTICRADLKLFGGTAPSYDMKVYVCPDAIAKVFPTGSTLNLGNVVPLGGTGVGSEVIGQRITDSLGNIPANTYIGSLDTTTDPTNYRVTLVNARSAGSSVNAGGTATGTDTINIWGAPGTPIGPASNTVNAVAVTTTTTGAEYAFTGLNATGLTIGDMYHLAWVSQGTFPTTGVWDASNLVTWIGTGASAPGFNIRRATTSNLTGATWSIMQANRKMNWKTYGP